MPIRFFLITQDNYQRAMLKVQFLPSDAKFSSFFLSARSSEKFPDLVSLVPTGIMCTLSYDCPLLLLHQSSRLSSRTDPIRSPEIDV